MATGLLRQKIDIQSAIERIASIYPLVSGEASERQGAGAALTDAEGKPRAAGVSAGAPHCVGKGRDSVGHGIPAGCLKGSRACHQILLQGLETALLASRCRSDAQQRRRESKQAR